MLMTMKTVISFKNPEQVAAKQQFESTHDMNQWIETHTPNYFSYIYTDIISVNTKSQE